MSKDIAEVVSKIQSDLEAPWSSKDISPEEFLVKLKSDLQGTTALLQGRSRDATMVQSALEDTVGLIAYASAQKELHALKSLLQSYTAKENAHGTVNSKRADEGARLRDGQGATSK
jgi:hypothetical protein